MEEKRKKLNIQLSAINRYINILEHVKDHLKPAIAYTQIVNELREEAGLEPLKTQLSMKTQILREAVLKDKKSLNN